MITVYGAKGCGSVIAEACLKLADIPYEHFEVDYDKPGHARDRLLEANPLCQVPALVLADGSVMTETLAVAHYVHSLNPALHLVWPADVKFLRWSTFLVTALYPTWTYGDTPTKWVKDEKVAPQLRQSTDEWRKKLWSIVEAECGAPYFLGGRFSVIDIYFAAMVNWRPGRKWFQENAPKVLAVAARAAEHPKLTQLWRTNFAE